MKTLKSIISEKLKLGKYILLLHDTVNNKYYNMINKTEYHDNKYYTVYVFL